MALYVERHSRLLRVSYAIRTANVDLCGPSVAPILGIAVWRSNPLFGRAFFGALQRLYGIWAGHPGVIAVVPGSPADRAGVRIGDRILAVAGMEIDNEVEVFQRAAAIEHGPVTLTTMRDGAPRIVEIELELACRHEAFIEVGDLMLTDRASANHLYVTSGFIRFARTDDELALVVSHEIAHRLAPPYLRGPEIEILGDHLGLYLAARAGYDVSIAPTFWDRVAVEQPWSLTGDVEQYGSSRVPAHGYMPWRAVAIRRVVSEIERQRAAGEPLEPQLD